jgi:1-phosphofructokinase/tagatose 6-phosphate kinase
MNAALDRILTVPSFQRGQRHRASDRLTLAGGKGITLARALKRLGVPVVATGLAGGRNGRRIIEELTGEAILNDFVQIDDESRTSTAVADPMSGTYTEIIEWGPKVQPQELEMLLEKLDYLSRGAEMVVFAGTLPRGVDEVFYAEAIQGLNRRGVRTALDSEGDPLRLGIEAEPYLVSPHRREAEAVVGQEFRDEEDLLIALDTLAGERGQPHRYRAVSPHIEPVSPVGAGAVLLAGFIDALLEGSTNEEALRKAVAAGAASTLEVGAGRFDPREVGRLIPGVQVVELEPVRSA